jgi:hypothetical protein
VWVFIALNADLTRMDLRSSGFVTVVETIRILSTTINARLLTAIIRMDQIFSEISGFVKNLNAKTRTKLMTGLVWTYPSARNAAIKVHQFKNSL